jgi:ankyrin repeat protein
MLTLKIINNLGNSPLHLPARFGNIDIVTLLLSNRADVNIIYFYNKVSLYFYLV